MPSAAGALAVEKPDEVMVPAVIPEGIQIAVVFEPTLLGQAAFDGPVKGVQSLFCPPGQALDAGYIVQDHRLIGVQRQRPARPLEALIISPRATRPLAPI